MSEREGVAARKTVIPLRLQGGKSRTGIRERRRSPRLAEIRRGANLKLLPPIMVTGAVRVIEFLLVVALGFAIYLGYVEREGQNAHLVYFAAVVTAAVANTLMLQAFDLYNVPAFSAFVRSFTRIALAWTLVMGGLMAGAFFGKVGTDFSRVWIVTWYASALLALFGERLALSLLVRRWIRDGRLNRRAVIVGGGPEAEDLIKALEASHDTDIRIAGIFDEPDDARLALT
jgi:FlaA1/EpsC-like NDP-sugar epimerase